METSTFVISKEFCLCDTRHRETLWRWVWWVELKFLLKPKIITFSRFGKIGDKKQQSHEMRKAINSINSLNVRAISLSFLFKLSNSDEVFLLKWIIGMSTKSCGNDEIKGLKCGHCQKNQSITQFFWHVSFCFWLAQN